MVEKYTIEQRTKSTQFPFYKYVAKRYISDHGEPYILVEECMAKKKKKKKRNGNQ